MRNNEPLTAAVDPAEDNSTRRRILAATAEVLSRSGQSKLSLSDVAQQAGVSRPTLYRWFASKEDLLDAFSIYEREMFDTGISRATAGLRGTDRLDAALRFIVDYQHSTRECARSTSNPRWSSPGCRRCCLSCGPSWRNCSADPARR